MSIVTRALIVLLGTTSAAVAQVPANLADVAIRQGWQTEAGTRMAAVHFTLAEGWKTYWRTPGDAGIPPRFDWSRSVNLSRVEPHWPRPTVYWDYGIRTVGYSSELVLPIELTAVDPEEPISLSGTVEIGVCREVCVPVRLSFAEEILGLGQSDGQISAALASRAVDARSVGAGTAACRIEPIADGLRVTAEMRMTSLGGDEIAIMEFAKPDVWVSEAAFARQGRSVQVSAEMVPPEAAPFALARSEITITVFGEGRPVEFRGCESG